MRNITRTAIANPAMFIGSPWGNGPQECVICNAYCLPSGWCIYAEYSDHQCRVIDHSIRLIQERPTRDPRPERETGTGRQLSSVFNGGRGGRDGDAG